MITLSKENLTEYLKSQVDFLDYSRPLMISEVGDGDVEDDGDGFVNFVFRASDGKHKVIIKQCRETGRVVGPFKLSTDRCELEYDTMMIRKAIVPEYVPELYHIDHENKVFITEDVSYLKIMRFQMMKSVQFENFAKQIGTYMARTAFYTSEYYLETGDFRDLSVRFMNDSMRQIMDTVMFLVRREGRDPIGMSLDPDFERFARNIVYDQDVMLERYKLRHLFVTKGECLIHGDLHTSNIFLGQDEMKVIDMEYTFCGPISYDMGYLLANFVAQFSSAAFRPFDSEEDRRDYQSYILQTMKEMYEVFCDEFIRCWEKDAKQIYRNIPGLQNDFRHTVLTECIGFAASSNLARVAGEIPFPDFDSIENHVQKHNAFCMDLILSKQLITNRDNYSSMDDVIRDMLGIEHIYKSNITEW